MSLLFFQIASYDVDRIKVYYFNKVQNTSFYENQINILTQKYLSLKSFFDKIINILKPFINNNQPLSL